MMRYFFLIFALACVAVIGIAGFRGGMSRRPPLEIFPDMKRQPKPRPQTGNAFFADGLSSRRPLAGTIPRSPPIPVGSQVVYAWQDLPVTTGFITGTTNFIEN